MSDEWILPCPYCGMEYQRTRSGNAHHPSTIRLGEEFSCPNSGKQIGKGLFAMHNRRNGPEDVVDILIDDDGRAVYREDWETDQAKKSKRKRKAKAPVGAPPKPPGPPPKPGALFTVKKVGDLHQIHSGGHPVFAEREEHQDTLF